MNFICTVCGKVYSRRDNLKRHTDIAHGYGANIEEEIEEESAESGSENASNHEIEDGNSSSQELSDDLDESEEEESDEDDVDIWGIILNEAGTVDQIQETVRRKIKFCRALKRDSTIAAIRNTMDNVREKEETMGFEEALDYALDKRKFLIRRTLKRRAEEEENEEEDGSV